MESINDCEVIKKYKNDIGAPTYYHNIYKNTCIIYCQGYVKSFVNDEPIEECMYCQFQVDNPERLEVVG
jgi:hypothetical protein